MATDLTTRRFETDTDWATRIRETRAVPSEYQELKFALHRKLLERINLEALSTLPGERAYRGPSGGSAPGRRGARPAEPGEKERITEEVLNEVFGLGPLEPLLQDPTVSDILVTRRKLVYVERHGKLQRTPVSSRMTPT
jgi:pilus assembly protein CpaF